MMGPLVLGIGIDIVALDEFAATLGRRPKMLERVLTEAELQASGGAIAKMAIAFAVKEAAFKAVGIGWQKGVGWRDAELRDGELRVTGELAARARALGDGEFRVSTTQAGNFATAMVMLVERE
jgi:holo-[acyl-carrier protein] synthase